MTVPHWTEVPDHFVWDAFVDEGLDGDDWLVRRVDPDIKRIALLAARACVLASSATIVALVAGALLGWVEPGLWLSSTVGLCFSALVTIALLVKAGVSLPPAASPRRYEKTDEGDADGSPPNRLAARIIAALRSRFAGRW